MLTVVICETNDRLSCNIAIWCLASQRIPDYLVKLNEEAILNAISYALLGGCFDSETIKIEGFNALYTMCKIHPEFCLKRSDKWLKPVLLNSVINRVCLRRKPELVLDVLVPYIIKQPNTIDHAVDLFFKEQVQEFIEKFNELDERETYLLRLWAHFAVIFRQRLIRSDILGKFLKVIEKCFNNNHEEIRKYAFQAWPYLIYVFSLNYLNQKRIHLIMSPIVHAVSQDESDIVREASMDCWSKLIYSIPKKNFEQYFDEIYRVFPTVLNDSNMVVRRTGIKFLSLFRVDRVSSVQAPSENSKEAIISEVIDIDKIQLNLSQKWCRKNIHILTNTLLETLEVNESIPEDTDLPWVRGFSGHLFPMAYLEFAECFIVSITDCNEKESEHSEESVSAVLSCIGMLKLLSKRALDVSNGNPRTCQIFGEFAIEFASLLNARISKKILESHDYDYDVNGIPRPPSVVLDNILLSLRKLWPIEEYIAKIDQKYFKKKDFIEIVDCHVKFIATLDLDEALSLWYSLCVNQISFLENNYVDGVMWDDKVDRAIVYMLMVPLRLSAEIFENIMKETLMPNWEVATKKFCRVRLAKKSNINHLLALLCRQIIRKELFKHSKLKYLSFLVGVMLAIMSEANISDWKFDEASKGTSKITDVFDLPNRNSIDFNDSSVIQKCLCIIIRENYVFMGQFEDSAIHQHHAIISPLFQTFGKIFENADECFLSKFNKNIPNALEPWVKDSSKFIRSRNSQIKKKYRKMLELCWASIMGALKKSSALNSNMLVVWGPIFKLGFISTHAVVANLTIEVWNKSFGLQKSLQYPDYLLPILQELKQQTPIKLPSWKDLSTGGNMVKAIINESSVSSLDSFDADENTEHLNILKKFTPESTWKQPKNSGSKYDIKNGRINTDELSKTKAATTPRSVDSIASRSLKNNSGILMRSTSSYLDDQNRPRGVNRTNEQFKPFLKNAPQSRPKNNQYDFKELFKTPNIMAARKRKADNVFQSPLVVPSPPSILKKRNLQTGSSSKKKNRRVSFALPTDIESSPAPANKNSNIPSQISLHDSSSDGLQSRGYLKNLNTLVNDKTQLNDMSMRQLLQSQKQLNLLLNQVSNSLERYSKP